MNILPSKQKRKKEKKQLSIVWPVGVKIAFAAFH